jgi:5-hydroxyisourate hydrolase
MPRLTTHALDIFQGGPAAGLRVELFKLPRGTVVAEVHLNSDGRSDGPLLAGKAFPPSTYELSFHVGDYFRAHGVESPFLDIVPIRFRATPGESYHVPLIFSPWAYQTYRGS